MTQTIKDHVFDMEDEIRAILDLAHACEMLAGVFDGDHGRAMSRVAEALAERTKTALAQWEALLEAVKGEGA